MKCRLLRLGLSLIIGIGWWTNQLPAQAPAGTYLDPADAHAGPPPGSALAPNQIYPYPSPSYQYPGGAAPSPSHGIYPVPPVGVAPYPSPSYQYPGGVQPYPSQPTVGVYGSQEAAGVSAGGGAGAAGRSGCSSCQNGGRFLKSVFNQHGMCCQTSWEGSCSNFWSELRFAFGSCRSFFGEPCVPIPPHPALPARR